MHRGIRSHRTLQNDKTTKLQTMAYNIVVSHNGQIEQATLDVTEVSERNMGADATWEVSLDSDDTVVMTIAEYPEGEFTEVSKHPDLETSMGDIVDHILRDREPKDPPTA